MRPARRSGLRTAITLGGLLAALLGAAGVRAQEELLQELKTISSVHLEGRHRVSSGVLRRAIKTRGRSIWPWREAPVLRFDYLRADVIAIKELYRRYGFLDAEVDYQVTSAAKRDEVEVTFAIREGGRSVIRGVRLIGTRAIPARELARKLWARPGRPFDPAYLQLDTLRLSDLYQEKGYLPRVEASYARGASDSLRVAVTYAVQEGERYRVGAVTVSGSRRVQERLITRELVLQPGSVYQRSRVLRSQERLYETGLFSQAQIDPLPDSIRPLVHFDVRLRERKPRWIDAGVGSGTEERFRLVGEWGHRNVVGRGLQSVISSRLTFYADGKFQRWHAEGALLEPWLLRSRTRGQVTPYYERHDDRAEPSWVVRQEFSGVNFQLRRELNRFTRVSLTQENLFARQELDVIAALPPATQDSLEQAVVPDYTTHRLALGFERDTRDTPFSPSRGAATLATAEVAGGPFRGTSSFRKAHLASSWYATLSNGWILATRGLAGRIDPFGPRPAFSPRTLVDPEVARVPLEDRFRIGGVNSIRGYDENSIPPSGGLAVLQGSVELRVPTSLKLPFMGPLGFEVYADGGNVWARPEYIKWKQFTSSSGDADPNDVRFVAGVGPRVDLPVGPLRVDVSWRLRPTRSHYKIQFAIGPSF